MPTPPYRLYEVLERTETGKRILEREFDLKIFSKTLAEIVKKYDIKYDPSSPIPSDDSLADDVWKAGFELYLSVGTLCLDTLRVIKFEEEEIKE